MRELGKGRRPVAPPWAEQARAMRAAGATYDEIAASLGVYKSRVYRVAHKPLHYVVIADDIAAGLTQAAQARGVAVDALAAQILSRIIGDRLVDAVLDDRGAK